MKWKLKPKAPEEFIKKFPEYPPLVLQLLYDRVLDTQEKIDEFFNPDYLQDLHDPFLMLGMKEAVKRIKKAIKKQEKIVVYADYDCDGVCGGVILESALKKLGANLGDIYIPDRHKEGFGLNKKAVEEIKQKGAELIITVDCGITNHDEIKLAKSFGMDIIITDHHSIIDKPPDTIAIDPHQHGDKYPFRDLAGAGVVFKLAQALIKEVEENRFPEGWKKWLLDLVALATVADMVPLLGENRTLVKYGLIVLAQTNRPGLKELMEVAGLNPVLERREIASFGGVSQLISRIETGRYYFFTNLDAHTMGFILGPRINVASSLAHANIAYELLSTESEEEARRLAEKLNEINQNKYTLIDKVIASVEKRIQEKDMGKIIFEASDEWPVGVIRWAAQRIKDKYYRPVFIINISDGKAKGSIRSIPEFNVVEAMKQCSDLLEKFGGHPCSAGCRLTAENVDAFKNRLGEIAERKLKDVDLMPSIEIDCEIKGHEVNWDVYDWVQKFAPFGKGNPAPLFMLAGVGILNIRTVGNRDKHLKMELSAKNHELSEDKKIPAIGFNHGIKYDEFKIGDRVDVVFEFLANEWNGNRELQLKIMDIKLSI